MHITWDHEPKRTINCYNFHHTKWLFWNRHHIVCSDTVTVLRTVSEQTIGLIPVLVQVPRWSPELFGKGIMTMTLCYDQGLKYLKMSTTHIEGRWRGRRPRARHRGAKRRSAEGVGSGEGRRSPSLVWWSGGIAPRKFWNLTVQICSFFSTISRHLLLHITHSSKVNCTLDKVNCTLCVRKHTILGPATRSCLAM